MDIAALSMGLSQIKVAQEAGIAVMKIAMDTAKGSSEGLTQLLEVDLQAAEQSVSPHLGANIDVKL